MPRLSQEFLRSKSRRDADRAASLPEKVLQFGTGNFLRAFADWMIDELNRKGLFGGRVVVVQSTPRGRAAVLNEQDGLHTLLTRGIENGRTVERRQIVGSVSRALVADEDWPAVLGVARSPELRVVVSNTTEAGIVYAKQTLPKDSAPASFPAKLAAVLLERYRAFSGAGDRGLIVLPCELIDCNGETLREIILRHAADWGLGEDFEAWLTESNRFLNTLVDRIVPGFPADEAAGLFAEWGYEDRLAVAAEPYHLWVIEGPQALKRKLPFHEVGLNVVWTDDLRPYRTRKVHVLNGAHTASVLAAYLAGLDTVGEMMHDDLLCRYVRRAVFDEILPTLSGEQADKTAFAEAVFERFRNPFIRHELLAISLNSVSKWKARVLPSLKDFVEQTGAPPPALAFSLAALIRFYDARGDRDFLGDCDGRPYPVRDEHDALAFFAAQWEAFRTTGDLAALVKNTLANAVLWSEDLTGIPGLAEAVCGDLRVILKDGARAAISALLERKRP